MARKRAVGLYWMWRKGFDYPQTLQFGSHVGEPGYVHGVKQFTAHSIGHPAPYPGSLSDATVATHGQMNEATSPGRVPADSSLGCLHQ
jgi:hypothetical protein